MSPTIETYAQERANATGQPYMGWLDALSEGRSLQEEAHLGERAFRQLVEACETPRQFALMVEALDEHAKEHPGEATGFEILAEQVNHSPYALGDWVEAIEYFYDWLEQNQRQVAFKVMLPFLGCCVESLQGLADKPPLSDLLTDMLDEYGFEG